jgi:hypothetical protein
VEIPDVSRWTHQLDADSAECLIFTFKEGLFSAVAHDLKLRVEEFELAIDEPTRSVAAIFNADSLRVITAMRDGKDNPAALSEENKRQIELNIRLDVLHSREYPDIVLVSESVDEKDKGYIVRGELALHGATQRITFPVTRGNDVLVAEVHVHQPDYGIVPYSAMMGAIRVRPTVNVRLTVPQRS